VTLRRFGHLARVVRPHSVRTRVAFVILAAMAVSAAVILWVFGATVDASTHAEIERAMGQQANVVARAIDTAGPRDAARSARLAQRFMGDVRMVVSVSGEVVYYSGRETDVEARATGRSGDVAVLLERPDPRARAVEPWFFYTLVAAALAFIGLWTGTCREPSPAACADRCARWPTAPRPSREGDSTCGPPSTTTNSGAWRTPSTA